MNFKHTLTTKVTRERIKKFVVKHAGDSYTLDLGCSNSKYSQSFPNRVGFDIKPGKGVDVVGDAHELPFPNATFDQILCTEVLEHLHNPEIAVKEMHRVLKSGGSIVLTTRFLFPIHDAPHDYFRYTKYGLQHLFRDWEVIEIEEETNTIETIAVLLQRIGFQTTLRMNILSKFLVFLLAKIFLFLDWFIVDEYGDIRRTEKESSIMTSGYYLFAKKRYTEQLKKEV